MNTITLEAEKNQLIRQILDVNSMDVIRKLKNLLHREEMKMETSEAESCYLTKEEVSANFDQATKEIKLRREGKLKGTPLADFLNEV